MSSQEGYRRRVKSLIKRLAALQDDDHAITATSLLSVKYMLRSNPRCTHVKISDDPAQYPTISPPRSTMPVFMVSQLEAQRLTTKDSKTIVISPIVAFVLDSLIKREISSRGHLTLVSWFSKTTHRSYLVIGHLFFKMTDCSYTIKELLRFHPCRVEIPKLLMDRVERDPDLFSIVGSHELRSSSKRQERSTETSEDVILKGNIRRRAARDGGQRDLVRGAHRFAPKQTSRESTQASSHTAAPESSNDTSHEQQREPESSRETMACDTSMPEPGSNIVVDRQPIPAPAGELAQRNEGFQRFWKAVVSPTHVRVTAGGKIVPNNRGPSSPSSKRAKETPVVEDHGGSDKPAPATSATTDRVPVFLGQTLGQPPPAMMPQMVPGFPAAQQALYPGMQLIPMAIGPQFHPGFAIPAQPAPAPAGTGPADGALKEMQNSNGAEGAEESSGANSDKVKVSPPEQFDMTKPFWMNGQIVFPMRPGAIPGQQAGSFVSYPVLGFPPGVAGPMAAPIMSGSANGGLLMHPIVQPMMPAMAPAVNSAPMPATAPVAAPHVDSKFQPPMAPHTSSILQSDITKKQIATFRTNLKYFEDQLQFNRHQIDEKDIQDKIQKAKDNIEKFTAHLQYQLQYEKSIHARSEGDSSGQQPEKGASLHIAGSRAGDSKTVSKMASMSTSGEPMQSLGKEQGTATSRVGETGKARYHGSPERSRSSSFTESNKGPGFSSDAALAPVFEPRNVSATGSASDRRPDSREQTDRRAMAAGDKPSTFFKGELPTSRPLTASTHASTSDGPSAQRDQRYSVPYLLGSLPSGVDPRTAKDTDYTYVRPLTDDEVRARFLYWGKAPKVVREGLPKYDGRHFYPPSPVKQRVGSSSSEFASPRILAGLSKTDPVGESNDDMDPFHMTTSARASAMLKKTQLHGASDMALPRHTYASQTQSSDGLDTTDSVSIGSLVSDVSRALTLRGSTEAGPGPGRSPDLRSDMPGGKLLKTMVKKGATSSAVSPATAQGYLPPYKGYAAASLSPSVNKTAVSPVRDVYTSPSKISVSDGNDLSDGGAMLSPVRDKRGENRPLTAGLLEDQFTSAKIDRAERPKRNMLAK